MDNNNTSSCINDDTPFEKAFIQVVAICAPFTILFNGLVLYIAFKFIDLRSKVNQFFVVSMTAADFAYGVNYMATRAVLDYFPYWMCRPYYVVTWMCQIASVMFLLFLNIDKFISLTFPLRYHVIVTERKVLIQTGICWTIIFLYAMFSSVFEDLLKLTPTECAQCHVRINPHNYAFMIFICYICPIVISLIISIYIFVLAQHKTRFVPDFPDSQINRKERKRLFKRIFFVFSSTIWTAVTSLPYRMGTCSVWLCDQLNKGQEQEPNAITLSPLNDYLNLFEDQFNLSSPFDFISSSFPLNRTTTPSNFSETGLPSVVANFMSYTDDVISKDNITTTVNNGWTMTDLNIAHYCRSQLTLVLVWSFAYLLQLGSVGNPVITIITQRAYRQRALFLWSVFLKRIHGPKICLPLSYMSVRRKSKSEDESTKVVDVMLSNEELTSAFVSPSQKRVSKQNAFELM